MNILEVSISTSILIILVIIIRSIALYKLPKKVFILFWSIITLRLLLPISIPTRFSIYTILRRIVQYEQASVHFPMDSTDTFLLQTNLLAQQGTSSSATPASIPLFYVIWIFGTVCIGIYFFIAYICWNKKFKQSAPICSGFAVDWLKSQKIKRKIRIYQNQYVQSPLTYGTLHPAILFPAGLNMEDEEAVHFILAHETTHIRHFDALKKMVLAIIVSVYWFNPFVWIMYFLATQDIELDCDETVVKKFSLASQSAYALTLLKLETKKCQSYLLSNYFNKNSLQERIVAIMKIKKVSTCAAAIAVVLVISATAVCATSAMPSDDVLDGFQPTTMANYYDKESGKNLYTFDDGKTYVSLSEEEEAKLFYTPDVEWWTCDEYKQWMDEQKESMESMIGETCWDSHGEYIWSQEDVDAQMKLYEETLNDLKNGKMLSKSVDGDPNLQIGYDPQDRISSIPK